jgi:tRNA pseudouridine32 synthase/23S rRNA pseudouridine746 synthase
MTDEVPPYLVPFCEEQVAILYEDDFYLIVNKPSLLLSIPGRHPLNKDCLITRLQQIYPNACMVHRLDLDTSGIMLVPITKAAQSNLARQFQERIIDKTYTAIVYGIVDEDEGSIDLPIIADWPNRPLQKICFDHGKPALTHFKVLERDHQNNRTRMELKPVTGRSHQLRIHMRELGHPILGCDMYAHETARAMSPRLLLHATTIAFNHPIIGDRLEWHHPPEF